MKKEFWSLHRPVSEYYGVFPYGLVKKLRSHFQQEMSGFILNIFSGTSDFGITCDIKAEVKPKIRCCASALPIKDNSVDFIIIDPPYRDEDWEKYETPKISMTSYLNEAVRVCKNNGVISLLHFITPAKPKLTKWEMIAAISSGPGRRLRALNIWRKDGIGEIYPQKQLLQFA